jgi:hypothetical protein
MLLASFLSSSVASLAPILSFRMLLQGGWGREGGGQGEGRGQVWVMMMVLQWVAC